MPAMCWQLNASHLTYVWVPAAVAGQSMNCGLPVTHKETVVSSAGPRPRATCLHCLSGTTKSSLLAEAESWAAQTLLWPSTTALTPVSTPGTDQGMQAAAAGRCQACHCSHSGLCSPSQHWSQTALDDVSSGQRAGSRGGDGVAGKEGELSRSPRHLAEVGPVSLSRIKAFSQGWPSHQPHSDCCSTLFSLKKREREKEAKPHRAAIHYSLITPGHRPEGGVRGITSCTLLLLVTEWEWWQPHAAHPGPPAPT